MSIVDGHVLLMSEYMTETPLWTGGDLVLPTELGLTAALVAALDAWREHFESHFHYLGGWDTVAARDWYRDQVPVLVAGLERALPAGTRVEADLWPLATD